MKKIIILIAAVFASSAFAAPKSKIKKRTAPVMLDKTYQVQKNAPQIVIGEENSTAPIIEEEKASANYWHAEILFTDLTFSLPALTGGAPDFSQNFVGIGASRKNDNKILGVKGNLEFGAQWQQYERTTKIGPRGEFSQEINVYQLNVFQNFNIFRAFEDSVIMTAGAGIAPIYLTAEQSIYNNSLSELGYQLMGKANFVFPVKRIFSWTPLHLAGNVGVVIATGRVAENTMSTLSLALGVDFE
ncbi:hypothetical protein SHI21_06110 [Bacteriovorax sp. PP10]|uniref:Outer membrane protein beta-barrel domain-containing protein n=1 Tax=Bacteriovorax antarcticus TaxID=3088717 RepID=A0ABU5VTP0_9BACT|nr:hypothetical protein [Bacteriovorax sp. PP10]MEA9355763.1 hypothetical protein [Bacteriovorax sp. PP10]